MPTLILRIMAILTGGTSALLSMCVMVAMVPHSPLGDAMPADMKSQVGEVGYAVADVMNVLSTNSTSNHGLCGPDDRSAPSCSLSSRLQRYVAFLLSEVYLLDPSAEEGLRNYWGKVALGFVALLAAVGVAGVLLVYGAVARRPGYFCPWQFMALVLNLFCMVSAGLVIYRVVDSDTLTLHELWDEETLPEVGRLFKLLAAGIFLLTAQMFVLCTLADRFKQVEIKKVVNSTQQANKAHA